MAQPKTGGKTATVYRMVMPEPHVPLRPEDFYLLKREGFEIDDNHLTTREETDAFKAEARRQNDAADLYRWKADRRI